MHILAAVSPTGAAVSASQSLDQQICSSVQGRWEGAPKLTGIPAHRSRRPSQLGGVPPAVMAAIQSLCTRADT
jgi:hypothetical protein